MFSITPVYIQIQRFLSHKQIESSFVSYLSTIVFCMSVSTIIACECILLLGMYLSMTCDKIYIPCFVCMKRKAIYCTEHNSVHTLNEWL